MSDATRTSDAKLIQTNYDRSILATDALFSCQVCLTRGQIRAITGLIEQFGWKTRWYSPTEQEIDQHAIYVFQGDLSWRLANMCCDDGSQVVLQRINPDTGVLEVSTDGGATYNPSGNDPRVTGIVQPPPVTSGVSSTKCDAAVNCKNNFYTLINSVIAQKTATATNAEIATGIAAALAAVFGGGIPGVITAIFGGFISLMLQSDVSAISAAFASPTEDELRCILYCAIGEDGAFDDDGFDRVLAKYQTDITSAYARDCLTGLTRALQKVGLNNYAALGTSNGADCSDCGDCADCDNKDLYAIFVNAGTPWGTETDSDANSVTVQADFITAQGEYLAAVVSSDYTQGCTVDGVLVSGAIDGTTCWINTGDNPSIVSPTCSIYTAHGVIYLQFQSTTPFTVRFTFA